MRRYAPHEIAAALSALDAVCPDQRKIILVGGAAVALHTSIPSGTQDIDHFPPELDDLVARCTAQNIDLPPFSAPGVLEYPWHAEDRVQRVLPALERLEIWLLEPHDLVLSKIVRWHDGDEEDVLELHDVKPLSRSVLIERYVTEMTHITGNPKRLDLNFIECIDRLFGEIAADEARQALALRRK